MAQFKTVFNSTTATIYAKDFADMMQGIIGASGIMGVWNRLAVTKVSNTSTQVDSGAYAMGGFVIGVSKGTTETMTHDAGQAGQNRNDLIIVEYVKDGQSQYNDTFQIRVLKGTQTAGQPSDPSLTQNDINAGGTTRQEAIARVVFTGTTLSSVVMLANYIPNISQAAGSYAKSFMTMGG